VGGLIPLTDASRRPVHLPVVTVCIILTNFLVFALELSGGDAFVLKWSVIPANILAGHHWITLLTAMFLHGSWSHILGNMVFLCKRPAKTVLTYTRLTSRRLRSVRYSRCGHYAGTSTVLRRTTFQGRSSPIRLIG